MTNDQDKDKKPEKTLRIRESLNSFKSRIFSSNTENTERPHHSQASDLSLASEPSQEDLNATELSRASPANKDAISKQTSNIKQNAAAQQGKVVFFETRPSRTACDRRFRQLPWRFLGYGMAVGESLQYLAVMETTGVPELCCLASLCFSACHVMCQLKDTPTKGRKVLRTVVWETLATLAPAVVVGCLAMVTRVVCGAVIPVSVVSQALPCAVGLCACVLIQRPMDRVVDEFVHVIFED